MVFLFINQIYRRVYFQDKFKGHEVALKRKKLQCDCLESIFEGLPCKHELCIYIKESQPISALNIAERWTLEYFKPEDICSHEEFSEEESKDEGDDSNDEDLQTTNSQIQILDQKKTPIKVNIYNFFFIKKKKDFESPQNKKQRKAKVKLKAPK